jgi:T5orf172 domain
MAGGWVYCLSNPHFTGGVVKIGYTSKTTVEERVKELSSTSVPVPFVIEARAWVEDPEQVESDLHDMLDPCRVNMKREFFTISDVNVLKRMFALIHKDVPHQQPQPQPQPQPRSLIDAVRKGDVELVKRLATPDTTRENNYHALMVATVKGKVDMVRPLCMHVPAHEGILLTAAVWASRMGHATALDVLMEHMGYNASGHHMVLQMAHGHGKKTCENVAYRHICIQASHGQQTPITSYQPPTDMKKWEKHGHVYVKKLKHAFEGEVWYDPFQGRPIPE